MLQNLVKMRAIKFSPPLSSLLSSSSLFSSSLSYAGRKHKSTRRGGKNILMIVRFIFPTEKPVVAHRRRLREECISLRKAALPPQGEQGRTFSIKCINDDTGHDGSQRTWNKGYDLRSDGLLSRVYSMYIHSVHMAN